MPMAAPSLLVFGATGAIGRAVVAHHVALGWQVTGVARHVDSAGDPRARHLACDPLAGDGGMAGFEGTTRFDAVCWAQGANCSDSVDDFSVEGHLDLYRANCVYVLASLQWLLRRQRLSRPARLVVVSSIWQQLARQRKLSYTMTKAAVGGMVRSLSVDLAEQGVLINAVLPSVLDTPMTAANLTATQVERVAGATGFNRLTTLEDVTGAIAFLCSAANTGVTGQSLTVDLGFSHARIV